MASCQYCNQEMLLASSCTVKVLHRSRVAFPLPAFGAEARHPTPKGWSGRCHDCGVVLGGFHHLGCDMAECPRCGDQLFACDCRFDEDGDNLEDGDNIPEPGSSARWN